MSSGSQVQRVVVVSVVGVGLVGGELVDQLSKLPSPGLRDQFQLLSLSSSRSTVYYSVGGGGWSDWRKDLAVSNVKPDTQVLATRLTGIPTAGGVAVIPVLVDNTSSEDIAQLYPFFLSKGINIVTPNKKAFSSTLKLYEEIVGASLKSGARFYNESTVGAGLPIISTIKDLVATGDKVRNGTWDLRPIRLGRCPCVVSVALRHGLIHFQGHEDRRGILGHVELYFQRVFGREERGRPELFFYRLSRETERFHGTFPPSPACLPGGLLRAGGI